MKVKMLSSLNSLTPTVPLTGLVRLPAVHHPAIPAVRSSNWPEVRERHGSVVVCGRGGRQAAGVGGVRWLAGWGGVVCQSEHSSHQRHSKEIQEVIINLSLQVCLTWAGGEGGGPRSPFEQGVEGWLLVHHGSVGLGAGRPVLAVGLAEDAVLVVLLNKHRDHSSGSDSDSGSLNQTYFI